MKTKAKSGLGWVLDENWEPIQYTMAGWIRWAKKHNDLKKYGFIPEYYKAEGYIRISFVKP